MFVTNQDGDKRYSVSGPIDLMYTAHYWKNILFGFNVYKIGNKKKFLLGTYDEESDAKSLVNEIGILATKGVHEYFMPKNADIDWMNEGVA